MIDVREVSDNGYVYRVHFTADGHPEAEGDGPGLTQICRLIQQRNEAALSSGRQHVRGWAIVLRGDFHFDLAHPWILNAGRVDIRGLEARFFARGEAPARQTGVRLEPGQLEAVLPEGRAGDILRDPRTGEQVPIRHDRGTHYELGWRWPGESAEVDLCDGCVLELGGSMVTFRDVLPIYGPHRRENRRNPSTAVRTPGWDLEDGVSTRNWDHVGDYPHMHVGHDGGKNGVRFTGGGSMSGVGIRAASRRHAEGHPVRGAAFCLLANTVRTSFRETMHFNFRQYIVRGGHSIEIQLAGEGAAQQVWAPEGIAYLHGYGNMNHWNNPLVARDLPVFDLGEAIGNRITHADLEFPFAFFQWGQGNERSVFVRARGNPVHLHARGTLRNFAGTLFDVPEGSRIDADALWIE